jgi:hypothetical protein
MQRAVNKINYQVFANVLNTSKYNMVNKYFLFFVGVMKSNEQAQCGDEKPINAALYNTEIFD